VGGARGTKTVSKGTERNYANIVALLKVAAVFILSGFTNRI